MLLRNLRKSILAQIILLLVLFFSSLVALKVGQQLLETRQDFLADLLQNEQNRFELAHILQKKLLTTNIRLQDLAHAGSSSEVDRILRIEHDLRTDIMAILSVIDNGGTINDDYSVNLGDEELISRTLSFVNYRQESINLQVIELRAKIVELDQIVADFEHLVRLKIALVGSQKTEEIADLSRKVNHYYKGIEPFYTRILENSNRLYFESQLEKERIWRINDEFNQRFMLMERLATLLAIVLIAVGGFRVYRSTRRILAERVIFERQLEKLNNGLEATVQERTQELQSEITERKQAELRTADQATFLFNIIEALSHPFYVIDAETYQVVMANTAASNGRYLGNITCHALSHRSNAPCTGYQHPCPLKIVKETGQPVTLEHVHYDERGTECIVEVHGYPIFDDQGKLIQMIEYCLDITDKKLAQERLKSAYDHLEEKVKERTAELEEQISQRQQAEIDLARSESHFRRLIENISDSITIIDSDGIISYTSPSTERIIGYSAVRVVGRDVRTLLHSDDLTHLSVEEIFQRSRIDALHYRVLRSDGEYCHIECFLDRFEQEDGCPAYILNARDITSRRIAEEETRKLQLVVEQSPSSVVITDTNGIIEYVNPAFEEVTGYHAATVVGKNPRVLQSGQTPPQVFVQLWETISGGNVWRGEFINRKRSGEFYEENVLIVPIKNFSGEITNYVAVKENITELKRAQQQAESANKAKSVFLSRMSHELRTPLNAINGFSQLMLKSKKNPLNDKQRAMTEQIVTAGNHLLQLINEVLDLAKIESGEMALKLEALDPQSIVDECAALIEPLTISSDITLKVHTLVTLPRVRSDYVRTKQVLLNLLSNAVKYNKPGGRVELEFSDEVPGFLRFIVRDNGTGVALDKQKDLFTPFVRLVDSSTKIEGSGIGLSITRQLVEALGGSIDFESELGNGSSFNFTLPLCVSDLESLAQSPALDTSGVEIDTGTSDRPASRILYIEDDTANIAMMHDLVEERLGHNFEVATNAADGFDLATSIAPDLILLDLNLPDMNGLQLFVQLKGDERTASIPVLAVSADAMEKTIMRTERMGFDGYISKPVDVDLLSSRITEILED